MTLVFQGELEDARRAKLTWCDTWARISLASRATQRGKNNVGDDEGSDWLPPPKDGRKQ